MLDQVTVKVCSRVEAFVAFVAFVVEIVSLYLMLFQLARGVESCMAQGAKIEVRRMHGCCVRLEGIL